MIALLILLVIIVALFALTSISQSYAAAQQAKAAIEAAQAAQIASVGNLVALGGMAILFLALLVAVGYLFLKTQSQPPRIAPRRESAPPQISADPLAQLTQLMTLQTLQNIQRDMRRELPTSAYLPRLNAFEDEEEEQR